MQNDKSVSIVIFKMQLPVYKLQLLQTQLCKHHKLFIKLMTKTAHDKKTS